MNVFYKKSFHLVAKFTTEKREFSRSRKLYTFSNNIKFGIELGLSIYPSRSCLSQTWNYRLHIWQKHWNIAGNFYNLISIVYIPRFSKTIVFIYTAEFWEYVHFVKTLLSIPKRKSQKSFYDIYTIDEY